MKLENRVAVITGGNSGIGLATAREFISSGAKVVIFGRDKKTLEHAAANLGPNTLAVQGDVRRLGDIELLFAAAGQCFGTIDVLVANAGIAKFAPVDSLSEELFDELSDILFKGVFFTVQKARPYLHDGASVVLVGSADADKQGRTLTSTYTAAKSAVRALARSLSVELLPRRIRVNVLSPRIATRGRGTHTSTAWLHSVWSLPAGRPRRDHCENAEIKDLRHTTAKSNVAMCLSLPQT